ncbi:HNH endonuclease [Herminiimonas contaminans]|uniref:HNH endonuclease n=1 Tax=Herminiimonas contaminans TaxID=1111140 RepID=A0ABS0EYW4_9BURK|nr:HNH endonuclease [Herminiimonas contaminans]MBF8179759.1 HNH endonuclease [Herminiimonas contaminans]
MAISEKSIKLLWANAAGRCSFPDCARKLTDQGDDGTGYTTGEMAHIKGDKPKSSRFDENQSAKDRDSYNNLILLCAVHHTEIDKPENEKKYSVEWLLERKNQFESLVIASLLPGDIHSADELKSKVAVLLAESRQAWIQYGPLSDLAKKNPQSPKLHDIWLRMRLTTIVPNNRAIFELLTRHRLLFDKSKQDLVSKFLAHVRSYEMWVQDEIPYQAVERFPTDFELMIKE